MPDSEKLLVSRPDASWLPPGGRADVVLAGPGAPVPEPTCVVRLLVTRGPDVLTLRRADGRGLDLPSRQVGADGVQACLDGLLAATLRDPGPAALLGYVRNVVADGAADYPWPVPRAHFAVWRCAAPAGTVTGGQWLGPDRARAEAGERHWWPLVAPVLHSA